MTASNKRVFVRYLIINLLLSSLLFSLMTYTGRYYKGLLSYISMALLAPSFFILAIFKGVNDAMHFTAERTYDIVSFISYLVIIAIVQVFIYRRKHKGEAREKNETS